MTEVKPTTKVPFSQYRELLRLNVESELTLWELLEEKDGTTIVAISHRREALPRAGNIVVLKDGAVEAEGKLGDLRGDASTVARRHR